MNTTLRHVSKEAPHLDTKHLRHHHVFLGGSHDENARKTLWVVMLTLLMMVVEIVAGYATGSMALLADGFHMATHAGALGISAAAYAYAKRHADSVRYSFGTGKVGDLAGLASAVILGLIAASVGVESVMRLLQPAQVAFTEAIWVAVVGLLVNIVSAALLSGGNSHHGAHHHAHGEDAHENESCVTRDNNLRSAYIHVLADAFTSLLAIAALLAGRYLGWVWLDPTMGIVGAVVIGRWSWSLMRNTSAVLLDTTVHHIADRIRALVEAPGDVSIYDLHVWRIGPEALAGIVSVRSRKHIDTNSLRERLHAIHELRHLTIEVRQRPDIGTSDAP
jgi:cation diffusion facilitator family transporter